MIPVLTFSKPLFIAVATVNGVSVLVLISLLIYCIVKFRSHRVDIRAQICTYVLIVGSLIFSICVCMTSNTALEFLNFTETYCTALFIIQTTANYQFAEAAMFWIFTFHFEIVFHGTSFEVWKKKYFYICCFFCVLYFLRCLHVFLLYFPLTN